MPEGAADDELARGCRMLARWWIRTQKWIRESSNSEFLAMGERNRMSLRWFADWLHGQLSRPLTNVVEDILSEIVFSQHVKVALSRYDGQVQRLRFTLGDTGIIPTTAAANKLGQSPRRMADRLPSFVGLLCDLEVVEWPDACAMAVGPNFDLCATS